MIIATTSVSAVDIDLRPVIPRIPGIGISCHRRVGRCGIGWWWRYFCHAGWQAKQRHDGKRQNPPSTYIMETVLY
jgi:hypothetical protein